MSWRPNKYWQAWKEICDIVYDHPDLDIGKLDRFDEVNAPLIQRLVDKATPEKPQVAPYTARMTCPSCGAIVDDDMDYCYDCGQRLDWSDEYGD